MRQLYFSKILLFIIAAGIGSFLKAQPVHISGSIDSKDINPIVIAQYGVKSNGEPNKEYSAVVSADGTFSFTIKDVEQGMYRIKDAFIGHKIFITPGDSVRISLKKIAKPSFEIFHRMNAKARYSMNYMFFDSCLSFFGRVKPPFSKNDFDGRAFKDSCHERYTRAVSLLNHFHKQKLVSDSFFKYARIELNSTYFNWLVFPFAKYHISKESIGSDYFKELTDFPFDNLDAIEKTQYYLLVANEYNNFGLNTIDTDDPGLWLYSSFKTAADHFSGFACDRLMAWKIEEIIRYKPKDSSGLEPLLSVFFKQCKSPSIINEVTEKVGAWALKLKNATAAFRELMEKSILSDLSGNEFSMNSLPVKKRWILIDCWASWCKPCKIQDPFFDNFRQKYKASIAFIKFSLDQDKSAWVNDMIKYRKDSSINYLVKEGNDHPFTFFFEIKAIPRFILIDLKNKEVVNDNMPFPENKEEFEEALQKIISE